MKRLGIILIAAAALLLSSCSASYIVSGPQGGLATTTTLPKGFDKNTDKCPMVILMHGIFSSKDYPPMPSIAKELAENGIGSIAIDFGGHGRSQGKKRYMTIEKEIQEANALWNYLKAQPYVTDISLLGHSQGGVIASMFAGRLAEAGDSPKSVILLAPGAVIKEATQSGHFFGNTYDPKNPPEYIKCYKLFKVGRDYLVDTQKLDVYGTSAHFKGPVCIIHGTQDELVPMWCSERYDSVYENSQLHRIEGESHRMMKKLPETEKVIIDFLKSL